MSSLLIKWYFKKTIGLVWFHSWHSIKEKKKKKLEKWAPSIMLRHLHFPSHATVKMHLLWDSSCTDITCTNGVCELLCFVSRFWKSNSSSKNRSHFCSRAVSTTETIRLVTHFRQYRIPFWKECRPPHSSSCPIWEFSTQNVVKNFKGCGLTLCELKILLKF
jgi:hypothetical protein